MDKAGAARAAMAKRAGQKKSRRVKDSFGDDPVRRQSTIYRGGVVPCFWKYKKGVRHAYNSRDVQVLIAAMIFINFLANCIRYSFPDDVDVGEVFLYVELAFTVFFTIELLINMYSHWFNRFAQSAWNWFDFLVVAVSLVSMVPGSSLPGMTPMRLIRAFRVFKLFRTIKPMRKIIRALEEGISGVCYAFLILILVISLYAIFGVEFFRHLGNKCRSKDDTDGRATVMCRKASEENVCMLSGDESCWDKFEDIGEELGLQTEADCVGDGYTWAGPCEWAFNSGTNSNRDQEFWDNVPTGLRDSYDTAYFGSFFEALYTLFQVMLGDSWNEAIGRKVAVAYPITGPIYFISYILVATIMLLNVAVAVLLEKLFEMSQEVDSDSDYPYRLQIRVNHATNLPKMDLISEGDPYVKVICNFYEEPGQKKEVHVHDAPPDAPLRIFETPVQKNTRNPHWSKKFECGGKTFISTVKFQLYDWENWCKVACGDDHDFIGEAEIELTEEDFESQERIHKELDIRLPDDPETYRGSLSIDLLPQMDTDELQEVKDNQMTILDQLKIMTEKMKGLENRLHQGEESNTTKIRSPKATRRKTNSSSDGRQGRARSASTGSPNRSPGEQDR